MLQPCYLSCALGLLAYNVFYSVLQKSGYPFYLRRRLASGEGTVLLGVRDAVTLCVCPLH